MPVLKYVYIISIIIVIVIVILLDRVPTPVAIVVSACAFAGAHLTPGEFPQLLALGELIPRLPQLLPPHEHDLLVHVGSVSQCIPVRVSTSVWS